MTSTTLVEQSIEVDEVSTRPHDAPARNPWDLMSRRYALPVTIASMLALAPGVAASTTTGVVAPLRVMDRADTATFRQLIPRLSVRGWAFAQRMSDAALAVTDDISLSAMVDDEFLVEPPDSAVWAHLPTTSWD